MDELEISGRRYISAVRAAKEHKYHSDYIGQLVRGGKVVGQKVGRAWYVDADSLAEYLGKEVPARGPMPRPAKPAAVAEPVKAKKAAVVIKEEEAETPVFEPATEADESSFVMPLRKSGRLHVIEAISEESVVKALHKIEPVIESVQEETAQEPGQTSAVQVPEAPAPEKEETFIPLKISTERVRDLYAEPEDSFYKVSRKGLRYVKPGVRMPQAAQEPRASKAPRSTVQHKAAGSRVLAALSLVLAVGIVSLGAGVLMSYYLHSVTTVQEAAQTSSVILSN